MLNLRSLGLLRLSRFVQLSLILGLLSLSGSSNTNGSILDGDPVPPNGTYTQKEMDDLGVDLFFLAAAVKGYAGGNTGVCIDFQNDPQPASFYIAMDSDEAFKTGKFAREDLKGGFSPSKLTNLLTFFNQYQNMKNPKKNRLDVDVIAYADPQHYQPEKGKVNINESIRLNRELAANRSKTIASIIAEDPTLSPILKTTAVAKESATLERIFTKPNESYARPNAPNLLACDTRRKMVLKTSMDPNDFKIKVGNGKFIPPHAIASPKLRGEVQKSVNGRIKRTLEDPSIASLASPELKAIAATERLIANEKGMPDQCKTEPFRSLLTLHIWGLATKMRPPKPGDNGITTTTTTVTETPGKGVDADGEYDEVTTTTTTNSVTELYEEDKAWKDDGSVNLTVDKYVIKGGLGFPNESSGATASAGWYDLHRTAIILNEGVRAKLRQDLQREPNSKELVAELSRVSKEINSGKDPEKNLIRYINDVYKGKNLKDASWTTNLQTVLNRVTTRSGSVPKSEADVWSVGGGSVAFQCFDVSQSLTETLKDKKNSSFFKSGKELKEENKDSKTVRIGFEPAAFADVKPADGNSFSFRPGVDPKKGVKGAVCEHCGAGIAFDTDGVGIDVIDRSLSNSKATGYMKNFSSDVAQGGRWGSLMAPVTYIIPNCSDCQCQDYFQKIKDCKNPTVSADGVKTCANGVIRINPLEGKASDANKPDTIDSRVGIDVPSEKLDNACIFTPPTFHTCGVSPSGSAEDVKSPLPDKFLEFFDPYQMKFVSDIKINDIQSKDALLGDISKQWCPTCFQAGGGLSNKSPRELINSVKCNAGDRIGMPTGNDAIDCPHLKKSK